MATATAARNVTVRLDKERETKNTVRFAEVGDEDALLIGTIYVPKATLDAIGNPDVIEVTIAAL
jgi:hypothetical protein